MNKSFKENINFPNTYEYSSDSDNIPLEFYEEAFPISKNIDLLLGYFSSNAIKVLSMSLAEFIYNGGSLRLVTNHFFNKEDYDFIIDNESEVSEEIINIFSDLSELQKNLSPEGKHFFDCLLYLKNQGRLEIRPVKFRGDSMSHSKIMILNDGIDTITTAGSINFTLSALLKNAEHFQVEVPWNGTLSKMRIAENVKKFNDIFNNTHPDYRHIRNDELEKVIVKIGQPKELSDLLDDSINLKNNSCEYNSKINKIRSKKNKAFKELIEKIKSEPKFPFPEEREIQKKAYNSWVENDKKGIFAMATGSGKTVTALNCVLKNYKEEGFYKVIIVVPTQALAVQWEEEVLSFNLQNIVSTHTTNDWKVLLNRYVTRSNLDQKKNIVLITTYATFNRKDFQHFIKNVKGIESFIYIADEAHNIGAKTTLRHLPNNIEKRIGLSATPERIYDDVGSEKLYDFFKSKPPKYTYRYTMKQAIDDEILCKYDIM